MHERDDRSPAGRQPLRDFVESPLHLGDPLFRHTRRRAVGIDDLRLQPFRINLGEELEGCRTAADQAHCQDQDRRGPGEDGPAVVDRPFEGRRIGPLDEPLEAVVTAPLEELQHWREWLEGRAEEADGTEQEAVLVGEVARQHEDRLGQ